MHVLQTLSLCTQRRACSADVAGGFLLPVCSSGSMQRCAESHDVARYSQSAARPGATIISGSGESSSRSGDNSVTHVYPPPGAQDRKRCCSVDWRGSKLVRSRDSVGDRPSASVKHAAVSMTSLSMTSHSPCFSLQRHIKHVIVIGVVNINRHMFMMYIPCNS